MRDLILVFDSFSKEGEPYARPLKQLPLLWQRRGREEHRNRCSSFKEQDMFKVANPF
jgi:hypothetical protein